MRRPIRSMLAGVAATGLAAGSLVACSSGGGAGAPTSSQAPSATSSPTGGNDRTGTPAKQNVTVTLETWASPDNRARFQKSLDELKAKTGITTKLVFIPSTEITQKTNAQIQSNTLPDVFWCSNLFGNVQPMIDQGILYDWTDYVDGKAPGAKAADFDMTKFGPGFLDLYKGKDGHQYAIPNEVNAYGVFYNADMFKAAGLSTPSMSWTWDDLYTDAQKLTVRSGGKTTQYGLAAAWPLLFQPTGLSMYSVSMGGKSLAPQTNWVGVQKFESDSTFTAGVQRLADAIKAGYITSPDFAGNIPELFQAGKVPMMYAGQFFATPYFTTPLKFSWGFAPIPKGSAEQVAPMEANAFCSPKKIKDPDAVWQVITWMDAHAFNTAYSVDPVAPIAYLPGSEGFYQALEKNGAAGKSIGDTVRQELANPNKIGTSWVGSWAPKVNNLVTSMWNPMLEGKKPVTKTMQEFVDQSNQLIAQSR